MEQLLSVLSYVGLPIGIVIGFLIGIGTKVSNARNGGYQPTICNLDIDNPPKPNKPFGIIKLPTVPKEDIKKSYQ